MDFASRNRRLYINLIVLGFIPELLIAYVASALMNGGFIAFFIILFGLQAIYFAVWLKKFIVSWVIYRMYARKEAATNAYLFFKKNSFPEPEDFEESAEGYLDSIATNVDEPMATRIAAACEIGMLRGLASLGYTVHYLRMCSAYESAIESVKTGIPPK
jgi:hypothetical protein